MLNQRATMQLQEDSTDNLVSGIKAGDRRALARAITLMESTRPDHRKLAQSLLTELMPYTGKSIRIGISGVPGVGKSTFVEVFGNHIIDQGHRLAVLSVDPSSAITGGSILGDKTRMETLSRRLEAYIRPSPTGRTLGGVTRRTREAILLCEAAGYDVVIVETVGVGQSETAVADMTDMFVLMLLPGGGDELQGIKRGIVELADLILVNKADGDTETVAEQTATEYQHALRLLQPRSKQWKVPVLTCSAKAGRGVEEAWKTAEQFRQQRKRSSEFNARRSSQARSWLWSETTESILNEIRQHPAVKKRIPLLETEVASGKLPTSAAAAELIEQFLAGKTQD